jgi:hypothetical protein
MANNIERGNAFLAPEPTEATLALMAHWVNPNRDSARVGTVVVRVRKFIYHDCSVTRTKYGFFVHLPTVPMVDRDGSVLTQASGKWSYKPVVTAVDKAAANTFSKAVLALIERECPEMLEKAR